LAGREKKSFKDESIEVRLTLTVAVEPEGRYTLMTVKGTENGDTHPTRGTKDNA
jgi:hypothetical protein